MRKTLLHKGGSGSLSNTRCLLSDANEKHGPPLSLLANVGWHVCLLGFLLHGASIWPSNVFALSRERLVQGSTPARLFISSMDAGATCSLSVYLFSVGSRQL